MPTSPQGVDGYRVHRTRADRNGALIPELDPELKYKARATLPCALPLPTLPLPCALKPTLLGHIARLHPVMY